MFPKFFWWLADFDKQSLKLYIIDVILKRMMEVI